MFSLLSAFQKSKGLACWDWSAGFSVPPLTFHCYFTAHIYLYNVDQRRKRQGSGPGVRRDASPISQGWLSLYQPMPKT